MSSAQTSLSGTNPNPTDALKKFGQDVEQLVVFVQQLAIHKTVRNETLEGIQDTLNRLQTSAPNLEAVIDARALWLGAWINLFEKDAEQMIEGSLTYELFSINNVNRRWQVISSFLKRSYLKGNFKPLYLRVQALLERIAAKEMLVHRHPGNRYFAEARSKLSEALLEGRL